MLDKETEIVTTIGDRYPLATRSEVFNRYSLIGNFCQPARNHHVIVAKAFTRPDTQAVLLKHIAPNSHQPPILF